MREGTPEEGGITALAFVNRLRRQYEKWEERFQRLDTLNSEDALTLAEAMLRDIEIAEREDADRMAALRNPATKEEREEMDRISERTLFLKRRLNNLKAELERII